MKNGRRILSTSLFAAVAVLMTMLACSSAPPRATSSRAQGFQFCGLERGMTESKFLADRECHRTMSSINEESTHQVPRESLRIGADVWDVWVYIAQRKLVPGAIYVDDHFEYAVFKNEQLVRWGLGEPSRELLAHPDQSASQ
jgi:hypothetical protein